MILRLTVANLFDSADWTRFTHFLAVVSYNWQPIGGSYIETLYPLDLRVPGQAVKFHDHGLNRFGEIRFFIVGDRLFDVFSRQLPTRSSE